jgi:hypothetical protein
MSLSLEHFGYKWYIKNTQLSPDTIVDWIHKPNKKFQNRIMI